MDLEVKNFFSFLFFPVDENYLLNYPILLIFVYLLPLWLRVECERVLSDSLRVQCERVLSDSLRVQCERVLSDTLRVQCERVLWDSLRVQCERVLSVYLFIL